MFRLNEAGETYPFIEKSDFLLCWSFAPHHSSAGA
jgi:hypothetical protein